MELTLDKLTKEVIGKTISAFDSWSGHLERFIIGEIAFKIDGFVRIYPKDDKRNSTFHTYIEIKRDVFERLVENNKAVGSTMIDGCVAQNVYDLILE